MYPPAAIIGILIIVFVALRTRYMSLGSLIGAVALLVLFVVLTLFYEFPAVYLIYSFIAAALIIYQHRGNISRLRNGTELRFGERRERLNSH
jgi:glycerol-3-phosphate acyltransferase PlsY